MLAAVALQTLLTFLQQNINVFENTLATTINEFVINELVNLMMLWKTVFWIVPFSSWKGISHNW